MSKYSESNWRNAAAPIISDVLRATVGKSEAEIQKALRDAYPFGPRKYHPYKIWCDEVRKQRDSGIRVLRLGDINGRKLVFGCAADPFGESMSDAEAMKIAEVFDEPSEAGR